MYVCVSGCESVGGCVCGNVCIRGYKRVSVCGRECVCVTILLMFA